MQCPNCHQELAPLYDMRPIGQIYRRECEHCGEPLRWKRGWEGTFIGAWAYLGWFAVLGLYFGGITRHSTLNLAVLFTIAVVAGLINGRQSRWVSRREESSGPAAGQPPRLQ